MGEHSKHYLFSESHEWVSVDESGLATIGITDHAQSLLGDLVFVELPEQGHGVKKGQEVAVVESVKAASDVYAPLSGTVVAVNSRLEDAPELVNQSPEQEGWLYQLKMTDKDELKALMSFEAYQQATSHHASE